MKMRYVSVLVLVLALTLGAQAYEKTVMVEYFSNNGCAPCGANYQEVLTFLDNYSREEAAFTIYHVSWPSPNDWYYVRNEIDPMSRWNYYVSWQEGVPFFVVDGLFWGNGLNNLLGNVNARMGQYTPVEIVLNDAEINMEGNISAQVTVNSDQDLSGYRLHACLTDINCAFGPGPYIDNYVHNMLKMNPSATGTDLSGISAGGSQTFDFEWEAWDSHTADNYSLTFFVQQVATKEIFQALYSEDIAINYPSLTVVGYEMDDSGQAIPNGHPDPGETVDVIVTLENGADFLATDNLVGTLTTSSEDIVIVNGESTYPSITPGTMMTNASDPFTIEVPEWFEAEYVNFMFEFVDGSGYEMSYEVLLLVGTPTVLVVDDSPAGLDLDEYWFDIMMDSGIASLFMTSQQALLADLSSYEAIVWATSNATTDVLSWLEIASITAYLDQGGKMLLTGENIGEFEGTADLLSEYFKAEHELDAVGQSYMLLTGADDGPFPNAQVIIGGGGGAGTTVAASSITPLDGAIPLFNYYPIENVGGVGYLGDTFSTAYLAFNVEAMSGMNGSWRAADMIWQIFNWMGASLDVEEAPETILPTNISLGAYPNPFNAAMTVNYTLPATSEVRLAVVNVLGQTVAELSTGLVQAGTHQVSWDASAMSSGVYFLTLNAGSEMRMEKVLLLK
ncbi:MAG TPA: T9SS type A sorting domain-containing protein [Bacteroidetes bacterium]|nr:hypothetical protein BMS3Bbin04_02133 [bacterium BMS3Bbin04]HDO65589.1 T9SS type A sorting domain-containing protein [Bacteroidota bacterium]HEX04714.1 T9SS type A sorting domain-containing protein [Bacteroidota bacterium]